MQFEPRFDIYALFMVLGVFQGILLPFFFLSKRNRYHFPNLFLGLLCLTLTIIASEILLNYTGLIVKVLPIENYSEPFVFLIPPLVLLSMKTGLRKTWDKQDWIHFLPFVLYFVYCIFYFIQPVELKYNSYVYCYQPDWEYIPVHIKIPDDPLGMRGSLEQLYISQFIIYIFLIYQEFSRHRIRHIPWFWKIENREQRQMVSQWLHYILIFLLILFVKIKFEGDLGDYIIGSYLSLMLYLVSVLLIRRAMILATGEGPSAMQRNKYEKSSLSEERKEEILDKLVRVMEEEKYFTRNTVTLPDLSKLICESPHHVSQVINEKLEKGFFDILAEYRIEEAKLLLSMPDMNKLTIEEIAEQVGYNSKAAFNKTFKKLTGTTPSAFRSQQHSD